MSDLSYEFGDIAWDEFCMSDDHTVPLTSVEQANAHSLWDNKYRKHCHGVVCGQDNARDISLSKNAVEEIEPEKPSFVNGRKRMLETEPVPQTSVRVFDSCNKDSGKEASLALDANPRFGTCFEISSIDPLGSEFCAADAIPTDKTTAVNSNSYSYSLSQQERDTTFIDETHDIKNSGDLLYYGWPDIGNMEEVEQIFSNEDEFGWFASPEAIEASFDGLKPDFKFTYSDSSPMESNSNSCEHLRNETHSGNSKSCEHLRNEHSSGGECLHDLHHRIPSADNSTNVKSETMDMHRSLTKHGAQFWGETKDQLGVCSNNIHERGSDEASKGAFSEVLSCKGIKKESQPTVHESLSHSVLTPSAVKFDDNCIRSVIPKEQYSSNLVQSYQTTPIVLNEKVPLCNPLPLQKKVQHPGNKFGIIGDEEEIPTEMGPSTLQESSSVCSTLDDTSLEAASFRQLQLVMKKLDLRTKLCIRDSLYRLARSAAQRNNHADVDSGSSHNVQDNSRVMLGEAANKYTGFMEIETDTNHLDRSVAHLLFHPSSAPSATLTQEHCLHNSATAIHGCSLKPHGVSEKLVNNEINSLDTEEDVGDP